MSSLELSQCLHKSQESLLESRQYLPLSQVNVFASGESTSPLDSSQWFTWIESVLCFFFRSLTVALDSVLYDKHLRTDCHFTYQLFITSICDEHLHETRVNGIIVYLGIKACCSFRMRLHLIKCSPIPRSNTDHFRV